MTFSKSTYYGIYPGGGACALDPPSPVNSQPGWIMVAAGQYDYQKSVGCGMCIEITANGEQTSPETGGPTPMKGTYKAYIVDLCGGCNQGLFISCTKPYPKEQSLHTSKFYSISDFIHPFEENEARAGYPTSNPRVSLKLCSNVCPKTVLSRFRFVVSGSGICYFKGINWKA